MALIEIAPYDPAWPAAFAAIAGPIRDGLGPLAVRVDHIGSTAVPGLAAKDRIDVQLSVADEAALDAVTGPLIALGYAPAPGLVLDHIPPWWDGPGDRWGKRFFRPPPEQRPTNLHVRVVGWPNQRYALLFRDYLRAHPHSAAAYAELKRRLAAHLRDLDTYPDVKDPACDLIAIAAEAWAAQTGWEA